MLDTTPPNVVIVFPNPNDEVDMSSSISIVCNEIGEQISVSNANITPNPTLTTCSGTGAQSVPIEYNIGTQ